MKMDYGNCGNRFEEKAPANGARSKTIGGEKSTAFHDYASPDVKKGRDQAKNKG